jgi:aldehyde dehydrogenase (NAD+)
LTSPTLDFDPASVDVPTGHFIGGVLVDTTEERIEVLRPCDGKPMGEVPNGGAETVDRAVQNAKEAFRNSSWATQTPRERAKVLRRWADLIIEDTPTLARLEAMSSTRPITQAHNGDVPFTAEAIQFFAEFADKVCGDVVPTRPGALGMIVPEPYGVVGAIAPWNFPLSMASWKCGPSLAAGNAVVLKPSELTPFSTLRLAQLAIEAGIPPGIFNVVQGYGGTAGSALVRHPDIGKMSFTGSSATGAIVMSEAAFSGPKPVTLELGGKSPQLVFDDAGDVDVVAGRIARGFMSNGGQACVSGTRLIVQRGIANALIDAVLRQTKAVTIGTMWQAGTNYSPIINEKQVRRIDHLLRESVEQGAEIITGGRCFEDSPGGFFYQPTLIANVTPDTVAVREEVFGPVLSVQVFDDEAEGIALAGHPVYGLAAGVHTMNLGRAMRAMRGLAAGTIWINRYGRTSDFIVPTGGFKGSGIGKDLGRQAVEANLRYKSVLMDFDDA